MSQKRHKRHKCRTQIGSLLLELGLTMIAVGALSASVLGGLGAIEKSRIASERNAQMRLANAALKAFVLKANRLPCPDLTGSGWEGDAEGECGPSARVGRLPYVTLNMPVPASGVFLKYGVSRNSGGADLVQVGDSSTSASSSESFIAAAVAATTSSGGTVEPYVAGKDKDGRFGDCQTVAFTPAYALMFVATTADPSDLCFLETASAWTEVSFMRSEEMLGWAIAQQR